MLKNVRDFEVFLQERISLIENSSVIIITSYLSKNLCEQLRLLESCRNSVTVLLLDSIYEAGAEPGDIEIFALDAKYREKLYARENIYMKEAFRLNLLKVIVVAALNQKIHIKVV
ncbi:MAG: hypothetical protein FIA99_12335 [Ruminiclostridium sp.]|nr:hypothetical protein [Ruminiclostridium sp.]